MLITEKFAPLAEIFFDQGENALGGSTLAIFQNGEPVLNLWQGESKPNQAWTEENYSVIFSCTKGLASILAHRLVQEGKLDLEEKVWRYWPEFAQSGKENIPVKWLLQHKAGLSAIRRDLTIEEITDGHTIEDELAKQEPLWQPGTAHAYHALTFGTLVGKLVHNITGLTAGKYFKQIISDPLQVDAWIGLPEQKFTNLAPLITDGKRTAINPLPETNEYWLAKAMTFGGALDHRIESEETGFNNPQLIRAELPGAGVRGGPPPPRWGEGRGLHPGGGPHHSPQCPLVHDGEPAGSHPGGSREPDGHAGAASRGGLRGSTSRLPPRPGCRWSRVAAAPRSGNFVGKTGRGSVRVRCVPSPWRGASMGKSWMQTGGVVL